MICEALEQASGKVRCGRMPVDSLTKDDVTKCNAALFDLMTSGRLISVDEGSEVDRRREDPGLKNRSQAASRKMLMDNHYVG
eukprot:2816615-Pyramimonas_sp.AAC.1